jgi:thiamine biosynthesis protein ThiI
MSNKILCRFGEVSTKTGNRKEFVKLLKKNIHVALLDFKVESIERTFDRLFINYDSIDEEPIIQRLLTVYGLSSFSVVVETKLNKEDIVNKATELMIKQPVSTFKVITRRLNKNWLHTSDDINRAVASSVLKHTDHTVDVHHPQIPVKVEIKHHNAYVSVETYQGAMGMPVRMAGKGALLLSGGLDSPIAGVLANKRGIELIGIHFETIPYTSIQALDKVLSLAQKISVYQNRLNVLVVPFAEVQMKINEFVPESYRIIVMRRMMIRIANQLAKLHKASVLITGESVGQVASQTLSSITRIDEVSDQLILRPLITYDKEEIIALAKKWKTFELSTLPYDDCCSMFTPEHPTTNPFKEKTERFESFTDYTEAIEQAVNNTITYKITPKAIVKESE